MTGLIYVQFGNRAQRYAQPYQGTAERLRRIDRKREREKGRKGRRTEKKERGICTGIIVRSYVRPGTSVLGNNKFCSPPSFPPLARRFRCDLGAPANLSQGLTVNGPSALPNRTHDETRFYMELEDFFFFFFSSCRKERGAIAFFAVSLIRTCAYDSACREPRDRLDVLVYWNGCAEIGIDGTPMEESV